MNKRRRFKAKRRRLVARRMMPGPFAQLQFHRDAFALVWPQLDADVNRRLHARGYRGLLRPGVD